MEKIIFDKNIQGLEHSIENGGMVFKLSGETSILPGTNLNMKIRLGQESIEDYDKRVEACKEAVRNGTIIFSFGERKDMYYVDLYDGENVIASIPGHAFNSGNSSDISRTFDCFKYDIQTGGFCIIAMIQFSGFAMNCGQSFKSSKREFFTGHIQDFI